ncbi:hypothetical protein [Thermoactinomyces sp. DSM 45892]|uniref:hypothetical protein n=1 Tax=Thermoactinomyces sp. DSM 45892 TaxID=1882753 RepID=UPI0008961892|nr:hypothetical protein [Thermoactinomyces sp. DSM 45892]SDY84360.1 hypothetical protein SAMN05444416_10951 [Thermoactinomyces sp. DSM 45892]
MNTNNLYLAGKGVTLMKIYFENGQIAHLEDKDARMALSFISNNEILPIMDLVSGEKLDLAGMVKFDVRYTTKG